MMTDRPTLMVMAGREWATQAETKRVDLCGHMVSAYARPMRCPVLTSRMLLCAFSCPMRCAVLTSRMLLPLKLRPVRYHPTDIALRGVHQASHAWPGSRNP
eukprot:1901475-Rhodomonas_salina.2